MFEIDVLLLSARVLQYLSMENFTQSQVQCLLLQPIQCIATFISRLSATIQDSLRGILAEDMMSVTVQMATAMLLVYDKHY